VSVNRRVSYQSVLGPDRAGPPGDFVRLPDTAIGTRAKDARREVAATFSKAQVRWLTEALDLSGPEVDEGAVLRALVDLGRELDIDWALVGGGKALRAAVREAVMVRRKGP
jgi:hypothetical protein